MEALLWGRVMRARDPPTSVLWGRGGEGRWEALWEGMGEG